MAGLAGIIHSRFGARVSGDFVCKVCNKAGPWSSLEDNITFVLTNMERTKKSVNPVILGF